MHWLFPPLLRFPFHFCFYFCRKIDSVSNMNTIKLIQMNVICWMQSALNFFLLLCQTKLIRQIGKEMLSFEFMICILYLSCIMYLKKKKIWTLWMARGSLIGSNIYNKYNAVIKWIFSINKSTFFAILTIVKLFWTKC